MVFSGRVYCASKWMFLTSKKRIKETYDFLDEVGQDSKLVGLTYLKNKDLMEQVLGPLETKELGEGLMIWKYSRIEKMTKEPYCHNSASGCFEKRLIADSCPYSSETEGQLSYAKNKTNSLGCLFAKRLKHGNRKNQHPANHNRRPRNLFNHPPG